MSTFYWKTLKKGAILKKKLCFLQFIALTQRSAWWLVVLCILKAQSYAFYCSTFLPLHIRELFGRRWDRTRLARFARERTIHCAMALRGQGGSHKNLSVAKSVGKQLFFRSNLETRSLDQTFFPIPQVQCCLITAADAHLQSLLSGSS